LKLETRTIVMKKHSLTLLAIGLLALSGGAASAQSSLDGVSVKVSRAGLDLNTEAGARTLLKRIEHAAAEVCGGEPNNRLDRFQKFRPCTREVVQRTVSGINSPTLTSVYGGSATLVVARQQTGQ